MHCVRKQPSFLMNIKVISVIMLTFAVDIYNKVWNIQIKKRNITVRNSPPSTRQTVSFWRQFVDL